MPNNNLFSRFTRKYPYLSLKPTRKKLLLFAITLIVFGIALGGLKTEPAQTSTTNSIIQLDLPARPVSGQADSESKSQRAETGRVTEPAGPPENWEKVVVKPGQSLDAIFRVQNFSARTLHQILSLNQETSQLKKIRPGDLFEFQRFDDGTLKRMRYGVDEAHYLIVDFDADKAQVSTLKRNITVVTEQTVGSIESSLFLAGKQAGLSDKMIMKLANLFGWDIDFVLDIRQGDSFYLIYEKIYREGQFLRDGEIVGATFINQGEKFQAIRFDVDGRTQYFAPDGQNMRKAFLRAPLHFSYISSNFNPRRFHPILKRVKPHNGIDYRAPKGTPVIAAGDGKVIKSAYNKYNGNYVFIQHANSIVTKYLHFSKRAVKQGQRVKQGQVIGYVGSTGLAQAPHLHYEFVVNGVHRNPRTVPLPAANPLKGDQLLVFQRSAAPILKHLSLLESASMYAISK